MLTSVKYATRAETGSPPTGREIHERGIPNPWDRISQLDTGDWHDSADSNQPVRQGHFNTFGVR